MQDGAVLVQAAVARVLLGQPQAALDLIVPPAEGPRSGSQSLAAAHMSMQVYVHPDRGPFLPPLL